MTCGPDHHRELRQAVLPCSKQRVQQPGYIPNLSTLQPNKYDGARPSEIELRVCTDLNRYIIPSTVENRPAAPNDSIEIQAESGRSDVVQRQAKHPAIIGARGLFELEYHRNDTPVYDGNVYITVSAYYAGEGSLRYATHPRQSETRQKHYCMTQLRSYAMTNTSETFRQGVASIAQGQRLHQGTTIPFHRRRRGSQPS